jgi:hypothetical protein
MWEPYIQAIRARVPAAATKMVFDRYHSMTHMGQAVDDVRKREHRALAATGDTTRTGSKYLWLLQRARDQIRSAGSSRSSGRVPHDAAGRSVRTAEGWIAEAPEDVRITGRPARSKGARP